MTNQRPRSVHASRNGTKRPLCSKRQGRVSKHAAEVTCIDCARIAAYLMAKLELARSNGVGARVRRAAGLR